MVPLTADREDVFCQIKGDYYEVSGVCKDASDSDPEKCIAEELARKYHLGGIRASLMQIQNLGKHKKHTLSLSDSQKVSIR